MTGCETDNKETADTDSGAAGPSLVLDVEKYKPYLDDPVLSEVEQREFLETVWAILLHCIDLGIKIEEARNSCGKPGDTANSAPLGGGDALKSNSQFLTTDFDDAATLEKARAAERIPR